jgi:hypothetical protein
MVNWADFLLTASDRRAGVTPRRAAASVGVSSSASIHFASSAIKESLMANMSAMRRWDSAFSAAASSGSKPKSSKTFPPTGVVCIDLLPMCMPCSSLGWHPQVKSTLGALRETSRSADARNGITRGRPFRAPGRRRRLLCARVHLEFDVVVVVVVDVLRWLP